MWQSKHKFPKMANDLTISTELPCWNIFSSVILTAVPSPIQPTKYSWSIISHPWCVEATNQKKKKDTSAWFEHVIGAYY